MRGIPVAGIVDDIDGDVRSPIGPNRGADEAGVRAVPLFGDVQRIPSQGTPFAIAVGDIDGQAGEDLAVPDFTNSQVRIYRNNGASRTFTHTGTLSTGFRPGDARFVDFDADGNLDLIVSGEDAGTAAISIFWGTGSGTFPTSVTESVVGRIRSIEPEPFRISPHFRTIAFTTSRGGLLPNSSLLGFLVNYGQRDPSLITDLYLERDGPGVEHDTLPAVMYDLLIANLDADSTYEIASLALQDFAGTPVSRLVLLDDLRTIATGLSAPLSYEFRGTYSLQSLRTTSYLGHTSSIVGGDFDGDGDQDLVTTEETTRQCVFLRNQGELQFVPTSISVNDAFGVAKLDYDGDGDLDFVTVNRFLEGNGVSAFLNDGTGQFRIEYNCHQNFASGLPYAAVSSDFDLDGRTDIAIASAADSVYVLYNFGGATNSVEGERAETPAMFALAQNYPNPFNPATTIRFTVPELTHVNVTIYDLLGRKMKSLLDGWVEPGAHTMSWDGRNDRQSSVASGAYVVRMEAKGFVATKKILLVR
jgi:hypothetical protein